MRSTLHADLSIKLLSKCKTSLVAIYVKRFTKVLNPLLGSNLIVTTNSSSAAPSPAGP